MSGHLARVTHLILESDTKLLLIHFAGMRVYKNITNMRSGFNCKLFTCDGVLLDNSSVSYHVFLTSRKLLNSKHIFKLI